MRTIGRQEGSTPVQPVKQKVRVYNPSLLSELLHEAEKAKQQQAQVRGYRTVFSMFRLQVAFCAIRRCSVLPSVNTYLLDSSAAAACISNVVVTPCRLRAKIPHDLAHRHMTSLKATVCRNALTT